MTTESDTNNMHKEVAPQEESSTAETNGNNVTDETNKKIVRQVEYYFGNYNLPRDKFLNEQVKLDDGWVSLETMVKFKRLADLSTNHEVIRKALEKSELMEVDDAGDRIRRSPNNPLPYFGDDLKAETMKRTIYCKGLPKDGSVNLDLLLEYFKPHGPYETIHMRQYFDKKSQTTGFKGSILIVFPDEEKAKEFMSHDDVQFKGMPLLRKWHKDYLEEKEAEYKERKARKEARLEQLENEKKEGAPALSEIEPLPRGSFLFAKGFTNTTTREDIKAALGTYTDDLAFVDFAKGCTEGYIRLSTPFSNKELLERLEKEPLKVNDAAITFRLVEGEEEDKQIKKAEEAKLKMMTQSNRKRKFGGRGGGFRGKKRKY